MILIVGLGNPGKKYEKTRHNLGFLVVESLKHAPYRNKVSGAGLKVKSFSDWKKIKRFQAEISQGEIAGQKVILAKPQTFMNLSGKPVKLLIRNKTTMVQLLRIPSDLWVIHDDIDLPLGKIKIVKNRGAGGHKGVESIIRELKTKNFIRFRIGIRNQELRIKNVEKFVLQKFSKEEEKIVKKVIQKTVEAIEFFLKEGLEKAMSKFNK